MGAVVAITSHLETFGACCQCGIEFAAPSSFVTDKRQKGGDFYCPSGHRQHYTTPENEQLKKQLEEEKQRVAQEKQRREWAEKNAQTARRAEAIARGKLRAQSERVKNGVCPCCNRTFQNLMQHMTTKHPEWKP